MRNSRSVGGFEMDHLGEHNAVKMRRLRALGNVLFAIMPAGYPKADFIQALVDESMEADFVKMIK